MIATLSTSQFHAIRNTLLESGMTCGVQTPSGEVIGLMYREAESAPAAGFMKLDLDTYRVEAFSSEGNAALAVLLLQHNIQAL